MGWVWEGEVCEGMGSWMRIYHSYDDHDFDDQLNFGYLIWTDYDHGNYVFLSALRLHY